LICGFDKVRRKKAAATSFSHSALYYPIFLALASSKSEIFFQIHEKRQCCDHV